MTGLSGHLQTLQRWAGAGANVTQAIKNASARTGVSFDYLMNKAKQESSFKADAKASTSSATGLFQFIDSTWLSAVKSYGDQFGLGHLAAKISIQNGKPVVADNATKQHILSLRNDPTAASNMVAAMTKDNADYLESSLGGKVGENELYMAHFLGLSGANKFLKARQQTPNAAAADLFPAAAAANKNVFYDPSGRKRSLDDVYAFFATKFDGKASNGQVITASGANAPKSLASPVFDRSSFGHVDGLASLNVSDEVAASQGLAIRRWNDRHMLESLMSGMDSFGARNDGKKLGANLLSPYTALVLAKLKTPFEMNKFETSANGTSKTDSGRNDKDEKGATESRFLS